MSEKMASKSGVPPGAQKRPFEEPGPSEGGPAGVRSDGELLEDIFARSALMHGKAASGGDPILALCEANARSTVIVNGPEHVGVFWDAARWGSSCVKTLYLLSEDDAVLQKAIAHVMRSNGSRCPVRIFSRQLPLSESQQHLFYHQQQQQQLKSEKATTTNGGAVPSLSALAQSQLEKHLGEAASKSNGGHAVETTSQAPPLQLQRFMGGWTQVLAPDDRSPVYKRLLVLAFDLGRLPLQQRDDFIAQARHTVADLIIFERLSSSQEEDRLWTIDEWRNWFRKHSGAPHSIVVSSLADGFGMAVSFPHEEDLNQGVLRKSSGELKYA